MIIYQRLTKLFTHESNETTAVFTVNSGISEGGSNPFASFGPTDYWFYGGLQGKCDIYYGQGVGSDAAEQIQSKIMLRRSLPVGHRYFIDISEVYASGIDNEIIFDPYGEDPIVCECCNLTNPNDPIPDDNMYDNLMFRSYSEFINHHDCLIPNEMNFYLTGMEEIIYDLVYQCFSSELEGKIFSSNNIIGNYYIPPNSTTIFHEAYIYYGISVGTGIPPKDL